MPSASTKRSAAPRPHPRSSVAPQRASPPSASPDGFLQTRPASSRSTPNMGGDASSSRSASATHSSSKPASRSAASSSRQPRRWRGTRPDFNDVDGGQHVEIDSEVYESLVRRHKALVDSDTGDDTHVVVATGPAPSGSDASSFNNDLTSDLPGAASKTKKKRARKSKASRAAADDEDLAPPLHPATPQPITPMTAPPAVIIPPVSSRSWFDDEVAEAGELLPDIDFADFSKVDLSKPLPLPSSQGKRREKKSSNPRAAPPPFMSLASSPTSSFRESPISSVPPSVAGSTAGSVKASGKHAARGSSKKVGPPENKVVVALLPPNDGSTPPNDAALARLDAKKQIKRDKLERRKLRLAEAHLLESPTTSLSAPLGIAGATGGKLRVKLPGMDSETVVSQRKSRKGKAGCGLAAAAGPGALELQRVPSPFDADAMAVVSVKLPACRPAASVTSSPSISLVPSSSTTVAPDDGPATKVVTTPSSSTSVVIEQPTPRRPNADPAVLYSSGLLPGSELQTSAGEESADILALFSPASLAASASGSKTGAALAPSPRSEIGLAFPLHPSPPSASSDLAPASQPGICYDDPPLPPSAIGPSMHGNLELPPGLISENGAVFDASGQQYVFAYAGAPLPPQAFLPPPHLQPLPGHHPSTFWANSLPAPSPEQPSMGAPLHPQQQQHNPGSPWQGGGYVEPNPYDFPGGGFEAPPPQHHQLFYPPPPAPLPFHDLSSFFYASFPPHPPFAHYPSPPPHLLAAQHLPHPHPHSHLPPPPPPPHLNVSAPLFIPRVQAARPARLTDPNAVPPLPKDSLSFKAISYVPPPSVSPESVGVATAAPVPVRFRSFESDRSWTQDGYETERW